MKKIKKLNIKRIIILLVSLVLFFILVLMLINNIKHKKSTEYKLSGLGYTVEEATILQKNLSNEEIKKILDYDKNHNIVDFSKETYFIFKNLEKYLQYQKDNESKNFSEIVAIINTGSDKIIYENIRETDISKSNLMLVNKYNSLKEDYIPSDLIDIPPAYAFSDKKISNSIYENLIGLLNAAKEANITLVVSQGYRSFESQEEAYIHWKNMYGIAEADKIAARAGHSDYQTGLAFDLSLYGTKVDNEILEESTQYKWIIENISSYGFIIRYPMDKEEITKFKYNPWRLRYVGPMTATYIMNNNITLEEYYAFYEEDNEL